MPRRTRAPSRLATYLGIDRTMMTYLIDDLATAYLVERRLNPADRRQRKIVSTRHGLGAPPDSTVPKSVWKAIGDGMPHRCVRFA